MKKQRGFINITTADMVTFLVVIALIGWGIGRGIEWVWPYIKAALHAATA